MILDGKADAAVSVPSNNALARRIQAPQGSLILVSEYSRRPLEVTVECPLTEESRVLELNTGKEIGKISAQNPRFTVKLDKERAVMLYVGR